MSIQTNNKTKTNNNFVSKLALAMMIGSSQMSAGGPEPWRANHAIKIICGVAAFSSIIGGGAMCGIVKLFGGNIFKQKSAANKV